MRWPAAIIAAVLLYLVLGSLLIAQRPGLYDDEGMMTAGAAHVLYSSGEFQLPHADHTWACRSQHCFPLMAEGRYIGAVKDLEIFELPPAGSFIETIAEVGSQVFNATMVTGQVMLNGKLMAQCEMKIFINP